MHLAVLGSSSAGNCTVVWNGGASLLIDCGFPPRFIERGLRTIGAPPPAAALITHVHGDHVHPQALTHLLRNNVPLIAPKKIVRVLERMYLPMGTARERNLIREAAPTGIEVHGFEVTAFPVPHDAPGGCSGYGIRTGSGDRRKRIAVATDLGYAEDGLVNCFVDTDAIVIESNHDPVMLETSGRPSWLKKRIRELGHLSNEQCAMFVASVIEQSRRPPHTVVLAHLSQECNTPELAVEAMRAQFRSRGIPEPRVVPAPSATASEVIRV